MGSGGIESDIDFSNFIQTFNTARQQWIKKEGGLSDPPSLYLGGLYVVV